jgi:hypothetical protein
VPMYDFVLVFMLMHLFGLMFMLMFFFHFYHLTSWLMAR